ncbi:hypothetical protein [Streptomyces sp. WAC08241]|uniref:hypothetical protein n=1 Tax=Streptomyces sp. WAC08241 TaxID=2487421 RepID=UPI000F79F7EA|nr:hypothetical protein [Streptomyces sp. WAC08241]RSS43823.1 hypothetical protein EF906_08725 [Streptomyces sp. WAC08241]
MSTPAEPTVHSVRIDAQPGHAKICLDNAPLPEEQITGYVLEHSITNALPTLLLHTRQPGHVQWQGLARVAVVEQVDPGPLITDFLRAINPAALDQAALDRDDLDGSPNELTKAMLAQLIDWAEGRT